MAEQPNWDRINRCPVLKVLGVTECDNCDAKEKCWGTEINPPEQNDANKQTEGGELCQNIKSMLRLWVALWSRL